MARLTVPEQIRSTLATISSMSEESFQHLLGSLNNAHPASGPSALASQLTGTVTDPSKVSIESILGALLSMYEAKRTNEIDSHSLIDDVIQAINGVRPRSGFDAEIFRRRMTALLDIPALAVSAKAFAMQRDQAKVFVSARLFSDIRPVFSDDADDLRAALVLHQLKIAYIEDNKLQEVFVNLDSDDISALEKVLARARKKSKALADLIEKSGLTKLD